MDFYSGSGTRKFISFRLDNEMSGQPAQDNIEAMETYQPQLEQPQEPEVIELRTDLRSVIEFLLPQILRAAKHISPGRSSVSQIQKRTLLLPLMQSPMC